MTTTFQRNLTDTEYNGWTNYETWNVALWLQNDEGLYELTKTCECYEDVLEILYECGSKETPDGVRWDSPKVNRPEINGDVYDF